MADIKKITNEFQNIVNHYVPYDTSDDYILEVFKAVLSLLKEQEPVKPRVSTVEQRCGNCNKIIEMDGWIACPWCGRRIEWSGWR